MRISEKMFLCLIILMPFLLKAEVKLPGIISSGMVLQRDIEIPVWGWASPNEKIVLTLGGQTIQINANKDGNWLVKFKPMKASSEPLELTISAENTVKLDNILIGDIWICSGQSNMGMSVGSSLNREEEIKNANYPLIRIFRVPLVSSFTPRKDIDASLTGGWKKCSSETISDFSAAGYFFGRELFKELNIPIGLIQSAWAGTPAIAWTSAKSMEKFKDIVTEYEKRRIQKEKDLNFQPGDSDKMQDWTKTKSEFEKADKNLPEKLKNAAGLYRRIPSNLYNGMIAPLIPFGIRGIIWYQGEDDAGRAYTYRDMFRNLIRNWRTNWGQGSFPFYFVQLANWNSSLTFAYAEVRESQSAVLDEPNTGMAVAIDIGDPNNVHPKNKQEVGRRLALIALAKTYGRKVDFSGPVFDSIKVSDSKITVRFKNAEGGLVCKGDKIKGFEIAEENPETVEIERIKGKKGMATIPKFYPAEAQIQGDEIILWNENVKKPFVIRYGWDNSPECNVYNKSGLPACPFKTDNWPGLWQ